MPAYRAEASGGLTLEGVENITRKLVEIVGDPYFSAPFPRDARFGAALHRDELDERFARLCNDDVLTRASALDQP